MPRRAAAITQADVARAIRAAKQAGASEVEVRPDGTLLIRLVPASTSKPDAPVASSKEIVL
jgi:hypothetical protein